MSESRSEGFAVPWPTVLTLAAVVGGVWLSVEELTTSRPPAAMTLPAPDTHGVLDVDARLWQDPLAAAFERRAELLRPANVTTRPVAVTATRFKRLDATAESKRDDPHSLSALLSQLTAAVPTNPPGGTRAQVLILPVMIKGGPYPENTESRLRGRQAILSALAAAGFVPRDGEHLGYFEIAWPHAIAPTSEPYAEADVESSRPAAADDPTLVVPYEWFDRRAVQRSGKSLAPYASTLILWLKDESFEDHGMVRLAQLVGALKDAAPTAARTGCE